MELWPEREVGRGQGEQVKVMREREDDLIWNSDSATCFRVRVRAACRPVGARSSEVPVMMRLALGFVFTEITE